MNVEVNHPKLSVNFEAERVYPELEDLEVTPTNEEQNFKSSKYGFNNVKVNAIDTKAIGFPLELDLKNVGGIVEMVLSGENNFMLKDNKTAVINVVQANKISMEEKENSYIIPETPLLLLVGSLNNGNKYNSNSNTWKNIVDDTDIPISNAGWSENSLYFNGANTEFNSEIAHSKLDNGYTIALRIKPLEWKNYRGIFGLHYGNNTGFNGFQSHDTYIRYGHYNNGEMTITKDQLSINNWHLIIVKYDNSTHEVKLYIDNKLIGTKTMDLKPSAYNLIFGRAGDATDASRYFYGNMSHCIIYDRVLNDDEIMNLYDYINFTI